MSHLARISWTDARRGLPTGLQYIAPGRLDDSLPPWGNDAWSVVCTFDTAPAQQGSPSLGRVEFMVKEAPHGLLKPGERLRLWEGAKMVALVEVLD